MTRRTKAPIAAWALALVGACFHFGCAGAQRDPLPSWNEGEAKASIESFVRRVTDEDGAGFVPPSERIAVFDNDGTLWSEQPAYFQLLFAVHRVRALVAERPELASQQPYKAALDGDLEGLSALGHGAILELVLETHAGMTTQEFSDIAQRWLGSARHPTTGRRFTEMVYQPMLELLEYLRANGFRTYIVSGGGISMIRSFSEDVYGIPPEQVIGSSVSTVFEMAPAGPVIRRLPELEFLDDKAGKPVAIEKFIGRRPIAAFGNSDGDLQMFQWTAAGDGPSFVMLVHHTDARREWAYDRDSHVGRLDEALDRAARRGWTIVDMREDWRSVFPPAQAD